MTTPAAGTAGLEVTTPSDREIRVERIFEASVERVWQAHTDPAQIAQWWGRGNTLVIERMEVEPGGHWRYVEHGPDGVHGFEGRYREVTPPDRIVFTFDWDGMPGYVCIETTTFESLARDLAVPHHRGTRRHARIRHGGRAGAELRGPGRAAGVGSVSPIADRPAPSAPATCNESRARRSGSEGRHR
jgi:uncharacterized protein YndB with AHSA1/START domain